MKHALNTVIICFLVIAGLTTAAHSKSKEIQLGSTLDNLQTAYLSEATAHRLYQQYAEKADEEGYQQLASMFRAIARGEEIHAANLAALINPSGSLPAPDPGEFVVKSTKENLQFAEADQVYETDVMYPAFIKQARQEKNERAAQVFNYALAAEPAHLAMYRQALKDLDGYRGNHVDFLVCPGCGRTTRSTKDATCPVCSMPSENFETVR